MHTILKTMAFAGFCAGMLGCADEGKRDSRENKVSPPGADTLRTIAHDSAGDSAAAVYACPMHSEVRQDGPGKCPKCGMALEKSPSP